MIHQDWLEDALGEVKSLFAEHGYDVPPVKVTLGFTSKGLRSSTVGECWPRGASTSGINHIFISPANASSDGIISTLIHECIHAIDNCEHGHGKEFKSIALRVGFKVPMRSTPVGDELKQRIAEIIGRIGEYRGSTIKAAHKPRIQKPPARARCPECGYTITMLKDFLNIGPPICPQHKVHMRKIGFWEQI